jgi:outer membrane protein OmpA-like peptidoglycan-associated protein/ABC-type nitrate/sulfonate/bicarbonate transport system substrate-binding protein
MRDAYATGNVHIGWATLDMMPLFMEGFVDRNGQPKDSRVMPRVFQQVDWSNGGDGIVARSNIKTVSDLRGKTIVLAQNSPSHYFALSMLVIGGVQPTEVKWRFTGDAFQAAAAYHSEKDIAGAVSWAPDICNLSEARGNRMLVDTTQANKLIADVWFARADFAKDHKDVCEGLVRGIFDAMVEMKSEATRLNAARLMGEGYNIPADETLGMLGDAHSTNWAENYQFFLNRNNPTNFETVWRKAYYLYRKIGKITHKPVPFNQVMDFSIIQKLGQEPKYANQKNEYEVHYPLRTASEIRGAESEIITQVEFIKFAANNWDLYHKVTETVDGKDVVKAYYPQADMVLKGIAETVGQFGMASVIIEGHADSSMKGRVSGSLARELSMRRANSVKEQLVKNHGLNPDQFAVDGVGWDRPMDPDDALNQKKNRRVEIKIYPAELK